MERTRTLIAPGDRERLAMSLERLSAGLAIRREDGKARLVRADPHELPAELPDEQSDCQFDPFDVG